jgi:hypothetical protein
MFKIRNDLIEAYKGYYEDDRDTLRKFTNEGTFMFDLFEEWIRLKIVSDSPKERLERYLEWNGISGYTNTVFEIATGSISV